MQNRDEKQKEKMHGNEYDAITCIQSNFNNHIITAFLWVSKIYTVINSNENYGKYRTLIFQTTIFAANVIYTSENRKKIPSDSLPISKSDLQQSNCNIEFR